MEKKLIKNLSWKILSLCLAFIAWIVIINIDDPVITRTITDIPVEIENEEAVEEKNKVYEVIEGGKVSVYVKGKRSDVGKLKQADILATADLSELSEWNAVPISVSCRNFSEKEVEINLTGRFKTLKIALEDQIKKQFQVSVIVNGSVADGYYLAQTECRPNLINVTGGESAINRIDAIKVTLNVEGSSENISKKLTPKAYDSEGKEIDSQRLHFSTDSIRVKATIWETKTVAVSVSPVGSVAYGYELGELNYEPKTLLLAGPTESLAKVNRINLSVDVTNAVVDKEVQIILEDVLKDELPENVKVADGTEAIAVLASVKKQEVRKFYIALDDIDFRNKKDNREYNVRDTLATWEISLMGSKELLDQFSFDKYPAYIDFAESNNGTHIFNIKIDGLPEGLILSNAPGITVVIENKKEDEQTPEPNPSGSPQEGEEEGGEGASPEPEEDGED